MRRVLKVGKWMVRVVFGVIALAVLTLWFGTRTQRGQMWAIGMVVDRVEQRIDGTLTIEAVGSPDLLGGATLRGVVVRDLAGDTVLRADSVRFDFALFSLFGPVVDFDAITVWDGVGRVERLAAGEPTNVQRLLRTGGRAGHGGVHARGGDGGRGGFELGLGTPGGDRTGELDRRGAYCRATPRFR